MTPLFLPAEFQDRGAWWATYNPWGGKELDVTEQVTHTHLKQFSGVGKGALTKTDHRHLTNPTLI